MRHWLLHPLIFYPLAALLAAVLVLASLKPQSIPRTPAPVAGRIDAGSLVLDGAAFNAPEDPAEQHVTVVRDALGRPQSLRIAVLPLLPPPRPDERGVFIALDPNAAAQIAGRTLTVEVEYRPLVVTAATDLAVSVQGDQPATWVIQPIPPLSGVARFTLPPTANVRGLGLRAVSPQEGYAYGVEIVAIRVAPLT